MSAPPLKGHARACKSKRRHADEMIARAAAMSHMQTNQVNERDLYVYQCPACNGWHLTKTPQHSEAITATDPLAPTRRIKRKKDRAC